MLGSIKNQWRVAHAKTREYPTRLTGSLEEGGCKVDAAELVGRFYRVEDEVTVLSDGRVQIRAVPTTTDKEWVILTFDPSGGDGTYEWRSE